MNEREEETNNSGNKYEELLIQNIFKSLLKKKTITIVSDDIDYTDSRKCQICHKKIENWCYPNHFHLYTEDRNHFTTFHFKCALKLNKLKKFEEISDRFDYIWRTNSEKKENKI